MKHVFIVNPAAGKGRRQNKLKEQIRRAASELGTEYEIYRTCAVGDAERTVRDICRKSEGKNIRFYSCGGDGTLNEVVNGAIGYGFAQIGVIPNGTGNDFVRNFEEKKLFLDITAQMKGSSVKVDGIRIGNRYAVNMVNMGFDCSVVESAAKIKRIPLVPGALAYIFGVITELLRMPGVRIRDLVIDGEKQDVSELLLCTLAGGGFYGGGFNSSPLARIDDGAIDVCYVKPLSRLKFVSLVGCYKKGKHLEKQKLRKYLSYHKCRKAYIDFGYERNICIDGEISKMSSLDIEVVPEAFELVLPEGVPFKAFDAENTKEFAEV